MCYFRRACNAVSFWRCLPIMTTLVLHTRVPDNCARSISYPYSIAEVSSCFTAHIHIYDEKSIGDTWEQRQMLTWCGFTVALKKGSARGCLYLGKGGGSCQCLWIAVECVWKTWKGNSIQIYTGLALRWNVDLEICVLQCRKSLNERSLASAFNRI